MTGNKEYKEERKQYTKQYLNTKQIVLKILFVAMNMWVQESLESELRLKSYEGLKLIGLKVNKE
jgi:hypothetical protein